MLETDCNYNMQSLNIIFDDTLKNSFFERAARIPYKPIEILEEIESSIIDRLEFFNQKYSSIEVSGIIKPDVSNYIDSVSNKKLKISIFELHFINDIVHKLTSDKNENTNYIYIFLGNSTFKNLRVLLENIDQEILNGISPRIAPMISIKDAGMLMQKAGYKNVVADLDFIEINYKRLDNLLADIRSLGISNCLTSRDRKYLGKKYFNTLYEKVEKDSLTLNFEIITLTSFC